MIEWYTHLEEQQWEGDTQVKENAETHARTAEITRAMPAAMYLRVTVDPVLRPLLQLACRNRPASFVKWASNYLDPGNFLKATVVSFHTTPTSEFIFMEDNRSIKAAEPQPQPKTKSRLSPGAAPRPFRRQALAGS